MDPREQLSGNVADPSGPMLAFVLAAAERIRSGDCRINDLGGTPNGPACRARLSHVVCFIAMSGWFVDGVGCWRESDVGGTIPLVLRSGLSSRPRVHRRVLRLSIRRGDCRPWHRPVYHEAF